MRNPLKLAWMGMQWMLRDYGPLTVGAGQVGGAACTEHAAGTRPDVVFCMNYFDAYAAIARAKGFLLVAASPLTRSSYHAGDDFSKMQAARAAQLERSKG